MIGEVGAKIVIRDASPQVAAWCRERLVVDNPDYVKKKAMGLWTGNVPKQFSLYELVGGDIVLPFGCLHEIHEHFPDMGLASHICRADGFRYDGHINLYPYQESAVQAILKAGNGILVMPCGAGKTQTALEAVSRIGMRTLWVTHTQDLLSQSMARAKAVLGCDPGSYGTITAGRVKIGSGITFATVQTASKVDLTPYRDEFGCIIVDECHRAVSTPTRMTMFGKVLGNLSCRYKIGLTATPKRADGMIRAMFALIGDVVHEVTREEVAGTTCPVEVRQVETGYSPDMDVALCGDGTINYAGLVDDMTHDQGRLEAVLGVIKDIPGGMPALVLANRVEYLQRLTEACGKKAVCLSGMGTSKKARQERKDALAALNSGEIDCLFATYQLAAEGLDCPNLRYVVFATPEKNERIVVQAAGRVARKADGKDKGTVIDLVDDFGMLRGWAKRRVGIYRKKLGFEIL